MSVDSKFADLEIIGFDFVSVSAVTRLIIIYRPPYYDKSAEFLANKLVEFLYDYTTIIQLVTLRQILIDFVVFGVDFGSKGGYCLLYTSPSPRD